MDPNSVLHPNYINSVANTLSLLVISNKQFCQLLSEALVEAHKRRNDKYKLHLVTCEHVRDILRLASEVHVDFIMFVLDTRYRPCVAYVESNLELIDKCYVCGRMCLVNGNPQLPLSEMNVSIDTLRALRCKYDMPLLNGDVTKPDACLSLADRLLRLVHVNLGIDLRTCFIPWLLQEFDIHSDSDDSDTS